MYDTELEAQYRGSLFKYQFTLINDWLGSIFDEIKWTLRKEIPASNVLNDTGAVAQATAGRGHITFDISDGAIGTVLISSKYTKTWPLGVLYWDMKGLVEGEWEVIDAGTIKIVGDMTRSI